MNKKPMMYYQNEEVNNVIKTLPKNTKSKFINLCVEFIISNDNLLQQIKNKLLNNSIDVIDIPIEKESENSKINDTNKPIQISSKSVKFGL